MKNPSPKQFTYDSIHRLDDGDKPFWFEAAMISTCEPLFDDLDSNYDVEERLRKAEVITKDDETDTETCALVVEWATQAQGEAFIDRLNAYLLKKAKALKDAAEL